MDTKRSYGDPCGVARALDRVGERWALLVVRELLLGPKRFTDLRVGLPHLSPDVLSERLRELEQSGVLRRSKLPPPAGSRVYELTEWGRELEPVVLALGRWGSHAPFPAGGAQLGPDALVIALKTVFDPSLAPLDPIVIELRLGEYQFRATVADRRLEILRGGASNPDATIEAGPGELADVLWHGGSLDGPQIKLAGDRAAIERFLGLFTAPQPASAAEAG
jgi:DNA-binding HxlR family transcriptional regulator